MTAVLLRAEQVARHFRVGGALVRAVDGLDFELAAGESVAFMGPSGSGKSTLLALLAGLDSPSSGRILLDGRDLAGLDDEERSRARNRDIGMVFQGYHLAGHLGALQNLCLPLTLAGVPRADREARGRALLERVGLADRARHRPEQLSGGERQRLAVARALIHRPRAILADEPTGQLDSATGAALIELIDELRSETGTALAVATHDPQVAARAARVIRLRDGRIAEAETTA